MTPHYSFSDLHALSSDYGDSFYLFDVQKFKDNYSSLYSTFSSRYKGDIGIGYSFKTNYTPYLCRTVLDIGGYAEVVSGMEYELALSSGFSPERIIFNGPYKSTEYFEYALNHSSIVNIDNSYDVDRLIAFCQLNSSKSYNCCIRLNFPLSDTVSRFGFEYQSNEYFSLLEKLTSLSNLSVIGIHCHFPFRDLDTFKLRASFVSTAFLDLIQIFPLSYINIGGGFMGSISSSLSSELGIARTSFEDYSIAITNILNAQFSSLPDSSLPTLLLEPGTALVSDTFSFFTKIISLKTVSDCNFAFVAGSLFDISPNAKFQKLPLKHHPQISSEQYVPSKIYSICGFTCIESDVLTESIELPLSVGDFLEYRNVGSYSIVMRPAFILPAFPIVAQYDGKYSLVRSVQSFDNVFYSFL